MRRSPLTGPILAALVLVSTAAGASAVVAPGRVLPQHAVVTPLALTGRTVAFGVGTSPAECRVRLWSISARAVTSFGAPRSHTCTVSTSTGSGVAAVSVATRRVAWLAYAGGNVREWSLFTASRRNPTPVRLRFAARSADALPPIVLGPGTRDGIPYAVGREVVFRAEDGSRRFRVVAPNEVRLVAAGHGPVGIRVVALTMDGTILALAADGKPAVDDLHVAGRVEELRLTREGVAYQTGALVHVVGPGGEALVTLPAGATMVDAAAGRILYARAGSLGAVTIATGTEVMLVSGDRRRPVTGQLDAAGLAWARGSAVFWRPGPLPD